jgi:hypothetical protein
MYLGFNSNSGYLQIGPLAFYWVNGFDGEPTGYADLFWGDREIWSCCSFPF